MPHALQANLKLVAVYNVGPVDGFAVYNTPTSRSRVGRGKKMCCGLHPKQGAENTTGTLLSLLQINSYGV